MDNVQQLYKVLIKIFLFLLEDLLFLLKNNLLYKKVIIYINLVSGKYPGRACGSPIIDLFLTFLSMGKKTINFLKK